MGSRNVAAGLFAMLVVVGVVAGTAPSVAGQEPAARDQNWHQFRGPRGTGAAVQGNPPTTWSESEHVRWKIEIPGRGSSTPIIWNDRIFLVTVEPVAAAGEARPAETEPPAAAEPPAAPPDPPAGGRSKRGGKGKGGGGRSAAPTEPLAFEVLCLDRSSGQVIWKKSLREAVPHEGTHPDNDFASGSPVTDGQHLFVTFGSRGYYCLDFAGNIVWSRDLGQMKTRNGFGEGASLALAEGRLIVSRDQEESSEIHVLDAANGETVWRADRDEPTSWATPLVVPHQERTLVVTNGTNRVRCYDLDDGTIVWQCGGQVSNAIPSPVADDEFAYCMTGFRGSAAHAIPLTASGDVTDTDHGGWSLSQGTPYVPSPLLHDGRLYFFKSNSGVLSIVEAQSGNVLVDQERIAQLDNVYASPVAAGGHVYLTGRDGTFVVIKAGDQVEVVAVNKLDDRFDASPAVAGDEIFLRGEKFLYCIGE
jgi:outer membrane protein assembly factor BamB